jgi:hypothetical protein
MKRSEMENNPHTPELSHSRQEINQLLEAMPPGMVEAKRYITQETDREPAPQMLQCMVKIATDRSEAGPRREIPRKLLALRTLADQHFDTVLNGGTQDNASFLNAARILDQLQHDLDNIETEMNSVLVTLPEADRTFLTAIHKSLAPSSERFGVAKTLARAAGLPADLSGVVDSASPRACREAAAFLRLMEADLAMWDNRTGLDIDDKVALWASLELDRSAYKPLSGALGDAKDQAFGEQRKADYDALSQLQRQLFSSYTRLTRILTAGMEAADVAGVPDESTDQAAAVRARIAEAETAAEELNRKMEQQQDLMENAVSGLKQTESVQPVPMNIAKEEEQSRRKRVLMMCVLTVVLAAAAIVVNVILLPGSSGNQVLTPQEFESVMPLQAVTAAPGIMVAETSAELWAGWDAADRQQHFQDLVQRADTKGFNGLVLTSDTGQQLAFWQKGSDPRIF